MLNIRSEEIVNKNQGCYHTMPTTQPMSNQNIIQRKRNPPSKDNQSAERSLSPRPKSSEALNANTSYSEYIYFDGVDLGHAVAGDQNLTLMDEVILLGLKDQQGYLSFLNDSISYVLRGCIILELAFRQRIRVVHDAGRRKSFPDRLIEVVDGSHTGEVLLDEAIRLMRNEKQSIATWMDLLSGETWNPMKVGYQLKQVRERVAKGLVDKGILRTEKHSFLFFDMATHPLANNSIKGDLVSRCVNTCMGRGSMPTLRLIALVCAASTANVLDNALSILPFTERELAFNRVEELLKIYSSPNERTPNPLPIANEVLAGILTIFCRLDSLLY